MWKTPRTLLLSGAALVVGLGVGAAVVPALAAQDPVLTPEQQSTLQQQADAFKACLEQQGVTLPAKPTDGSRPELSDEQKAALRAGFEACQSQRPDRPALSDEQKAKLQSQFEQYRACLEAQGLTMPGRPAPSPDGTPPQPPQNQGRQITDEQWAQIQAARTACADLAPNLGLGAGPFGGLGRPGGFGHGLGGPLGPMGPGPQAGSGQTTT